MKSDEPLFVGNPRFSEALDWIVRDSDEQRAFKTLIFEELLPVDADFAFYVHFDEVTGMLMMPEYPGDAVERVTAWEETRRNLEVVATRLAGRDVSSFVKDDRFYRLRFQRFSETDWGRFHEVLATLPGWMNSTPGEEMARWFGVDESFPPFLWGSVEDFGYEAFGVLPRATWTQWHNAFVEGTRGLPALTARGLEIVEEGESG